jgi:ABC-type polysaccharide/polyol phosphate export permease
MMTALKKVPPAFDDIYRAISLRRVVTFMALSDLRARYKRSILGPFWLSLSTAAGSAGLGFLWSELMKIDPRTFVPTLTAGLILWQLISGVITESTTVFGRQASIIRNLSLPLSIHPIQLLFRHLINLAHNAPVFILAALVLGMPFKSTVWLVIPALILVTLNLLWMVMLTSLLGARFRDLEYFVSSIMPLLMLVSPVFYRPNYLPFSQTVIWFNPLSHLIEIVRYPLLGEVPPHFVFYTNLIMLVAGWTFTLWLFNRKHHRVAFWV